MARARRAGSGLAVVYLDLDAFKQVNDSLGHAGGDALLREVADRLASAVRDGDLLGRMGGDEFVALLDPVAGPAEAAEAAESLRERVAGGPPPPGGTGAIRLSIGCAFFPDDGDRLDVLLEVADRAMYRAKQAQHADH